LTELKRVLRLGDSVAVIIGIIVGSGIFFTPTVTARYLGSYEMVLVVWLLGGVVALCGALTYAELAAAWPHTGGMYVFLRECYGKLPSFLFGWAQLLIIRPSAVAAISVIFAQYLAYFVPVTQTGVKLIAITAILVVSIVNFLGVRLTSVIQNILTSFKLLALIAIALLGLFFVPFGSVWTDPTPPLSGILDASFLSLAGAALVSVFWTYDGWTEITSVAGEVRDPERTIPRALLIASLIVLVVYMLVNVSYLNVLGLEGMKNSERVASDAMIRVLGPIGGALAAGAVVMSTFGTLNGTALTGPRIFFAMAVDGLFFAWGRKVHPTFRSPSTAIALQAFLGIPLVITWTFDQLTTYFVFISLLFYSACTLAVFRLRSMPDAPKTGYKTWGFPVTPAIFLLVAFGVLGNTVVTSPLQVIVGGAILLSGIPVFYIWRIARKS